MLYIAYFGQEPGFLDLENISDLFGVCPISIARASNLASEDTRLFPGQLLLVPISCGCSGNQSLANITYEIKQGDSYYLVSTTAFEYLTNLHVVEDMNPALNPVQLEIGVKSVSAKFNASSTDIRAENNYQNFGSQEGIPIMIPVSQLPVLSQTYPSKQTKFKHQGILIAVASTVCTVVIFVLAALLTQTYTPHVEVGKSGGFQPKIIQDKLLPGVFRYLDKPIMYEVIEILDATMNFSQEYRIGGSVYGATINGKILAIKKTKEDVTEELKILQKVNHVILLKSLGISSDSDGNCFLVYEYAEKGSLNKWLYPKSSSSSNSGAFLTWGQRLNIALDVANGLQYMHEHIHPSIVHGDIRTSNILLDSSFKAKLANFFLAMTATNSVMPKADVFAFGIILLELLSGKKVMETKENGEVSMLWKEIREVLEKEEKKEERLRKWIDPNLERLYPIDGALSLAV
ncbi:hypothetical protein SLEP1_g12005 [Rubroshorea leprosula]|nr:hypothetical protein SLEP1_g12005 [Rubroshorea leprosula]